MLKSFSLLLRRKPTKLLKTSKPSYMAKIQFSPGDRFVCDVNGERGLGLVLPDMTSLIISGKGGRSGYTVIKTNIPSDSSLHYSQYEFPHEIIFALDCVASSHDLSISTARF